MSEEIKIEVPEFMTVKEVSEVLGFSQATVRKLVHDGQLKAFYNGRGSRMKIVKQSVADFVNEALK